MIKQKSQFGFSLVELLVSLSLFIMVLTTAVGCLLVVIDANARAQNMQTVMTNVSFALDSMTREIRTGSGYYCSGTDIDADLAKDQLRDCINGTYLSIVEGGISITGGQDNSRITYRYNSDEMTVERRVGNNNWYPITAPGVRITSMYFYVTDSRKPDDGNLLQPAVTIYIEGFAGELKSTESSFALQTTVTKRILDI
jgi:type II secretory pathway pseudopilin PulG